jgi:hypothetical protein
VRLKPAEFIRDAGTEQIRAWDELVPWVQRECRALVTAYDAARTYTAILEYELPRDLFAHQPLPRINRARAATEPAVSSITASRCNRCGRDPGARSF